MARKALIEKNNKRIEMVRLNEEKRAELRKLAKTGDQDAQRALARMRRDTSYTRIKNRDQIDGRPHAFMRKFGLSRINFRKKAHKGEIPGIKKASW